MKIDLGRQFTRLPGGRYRRDGEGSGEAFRDDMLLPALRSGEVVEVALDNTYGFLPSFVEEAFGGLVRAGLPFDKLKKTLRITAKKDVNAVHVELAWQCIQAAEEASCTGCALRDLCCEAGIAMSETKPGAAV